MYAKTLRGRSFPRNITKPRTVALCTWRQYLLRTLTYSRRQTAGPTR